MGSSGMKRKKTKQKTFFRSTIMSICRTKLKWFSYLIVTLVFVSFVGMLCAVLSGCGHTITHTDRGTGLVARIPLPDGSSLIDLKIGKIDSTTTVLRGNSTYDSSASTGGTLFGSASTSDRTFVATGLQLNEGYLKEVLTSPDVDPDTKVALAKAIVQVKAAKSNPSVTKSVGAATSVGEKPDVEVQPVAVGVDNVVNKVAEVTPKVVAPVADATKSVVKDVASTVSDVSEDWSSVFVKWWWVLVAVVVAVVSIVIWIKKKKSSENKF